MRKQTKIAALVSAAALLAIGASMTASANTWSGVDGSLDWTWVDRNGNAIEEEGWHRGNSNWGSNAQYYYFADENGEMAIDRPVEWGADLYYVDELGRRVTNTWKLVDLEDGYTMPDGTDVDSVYYFFGSNGKAVRASEGNEFEAKKVIKDTGRTDTGTFVFSEDGYMILGRVPVGSSIYYCVQPDDSYFIGLTEGTAWNYVTGEALNGWAKMDVEVMLDETDIDPDYNNVEWFYFDSCKLYRTAGPKAISGVNYTFDENGVLGYWGATATHGSASPYSNYKVYVDGDNYTSTTGNKWLNFQDDDWYYIINAREADGKSAFQKGVIFNYDLGDDVESSDDDCKGPARLIKVGGKTFLIGNNGVMKVGYNKVEKADVEKWLKDTPDSDGYANWNGTSFKYYVPVKTATDLYFFFDDSTDHDGDRGELQVGRHSYTDEDGVVRTRFFKADGTTEAYAICDNYLFENGELVVAEDGDYRVVELDTASAVYQYTVKSGKLTAKAFQAEAATSKIKVVVDKNGRLKKSTSSKGVLADDGHYYVLKDYKVTEVDPK